MCTGKPVLAVLKDVKNEVVESATRVQAILNGNAKYTQPWANIVRGYLAMHIASPRYKLRVLGIYEENPFAPFESIITQFFERIGE